MAICPGDARLPRYKKGSVLPVFRKLSQTKSIGLHLLTRDIWSNAHECYQRQIKTGRVRPREAECLGETELPWETGYKPYHHGLVEGIVHVNPWILEFGLLVYVDIEARCIYSKPGLDKFDFDINEVIFSEKKLLNPPSCVREGRRCFTEPPKNLDIYSYETRSLYAKLGGPVGGNYEKNEELSSSGVIIGKALHNRKNTTFVPATNAKKTSGAIDHPYVTYNFPFRFDISSGPDSLYLKMQNSTNPNVQKRKNLFYESVFGFGCQEEDSDDDEESDTDDEITLGTLPIRQPGEAIKTIKQSFSKNSKARQREKDLFHPDSYPWRSRRKRIPHDGIFWLVRAYAVKSCCDLPDIKHLAKMRIRKQTYLPRLVSLCWHPPPSVHTDYCLAINTEEKHDAGVITLVAKLDRLIYQPGDHIEVSIKLQNQSVRLLEKITVSMHQCIRCRFWRNKIWRSPLCHRELTTDSLITRLPIMPGSSNSRYRVNLNPWPTSTSINNVITGYNRCSVRPSGILGGDKAWTLAVPRIDNKLYALQLPGRHQLVPPCHLQRHILSPSSIEYLINCLLSNEQTQKTDTDTIEPNWSENPYSHCRCKRRTQKENFRSTVSRPDLPPYSLTNEHTNDLLDDNTEYDINQFWPTCDDCSRSFKNNLEKLRPIHISYEVEVHVSFLKKTSEDKLAGEGLVRGNTSLGSGLLIDPVGTIEGTDGPRVTLPCYLSWLEPQPENPIPVANYNIDQRQELPKQTTIKPNIWEPSLGKGFYVSKNFTQTECKCYL